MKRDLERRGGEGGMIKGSKEADPSLSRVRALAQDDSSARRVKKGKGGEVISFLCYAKRSEPVILSAAGAKDLLFQVLACPSVLVGINWKCLRGVRVADCRYANESQGALRSPAFHFACAPGLYCRCEPPGQSLSRAQRGAPGVSRTSRSFGSCK